MPRPARSLRARIKGLIPRSRGIDRAAVAAAYIRGDGLEIGGLQNPLEVPSSASVSYVDRLPVPALRKHYPELEGQRLVDVDVIDDGERLSKFPDSSQDFVVANHFLEHCEDPIAALLTFFRVLRPGGVLYLAVPDKRFTFDRDRPVTPLEHLIQDHEHGPERSRRQHFEEWVRLVVKPADEAAAREAVRHLMDIDYSIHHHVWTQAELLELLGWLRVRVPFELELFLRGGDEMIAILRKPDERG